MGVKYDVLDKTGEGTGLRYELRKPELMLEIVTINEETGLQSVIAFVATECRTIEEAFEWLRWKKLIDKARDAQNGQT